MSFYGSFSARAKRAIFLAHSQALMEGAEEITPEHILSALLKEDPTLFVLVVPQQPNSAHEIEQLLVAAGRISTMRKSPGAKPVLSLGSKEVVWTASEERKRLSSEICWHSAFVVGIARHAMEAERLAPHASATKQFNGKTDS